MVRRSGLNVEGPLTRPASGAWQLLLLIAAILGGAGAVLAVGKSVAHDEAKAVVAPVEKAMSDHLARTEAMIPQMMAYAHDQKSAIESMQSNQYRICLKLGLDTCESPRSRATPNFDRPGER